MTYLSEHLGIVIGLAASVLYILAFLAAIHAVMKARTSQGAIAWAMALITFPYLAVPLYAIFGRSKFRGYVDARRVGDHETRDIAVKLRDEHGEKIRAQFKEAEAPCQTLENLARMPFTGHNEARLLIDGDATFGAIFEGIESARDYILIQFFIVKNDELGIELKDRLIRKAQEGVHVYFLYDEIGCHALPRSYVRELTEAGAVIRPFKTTQGRANRFQINFRNHRKIVIIDGHTAYVGGLNVGDEYMGRHPVLSPWRDTHAMVSGPVVLGVQISFLEDWYWAAREVPRLTWSPHMEAGGEKRILVLPTGPADESDTCSLFFVHLINTSRDRVWIVSPYFVPDESVSSALKLAAMRGVDVRVMIPERPDHKIVYLAAFSCLQEVEKAGVRIFRYREGFLHQKVFLVDDDLAGVGTANLDNRSLRLNFEITLTFADKEFAREVEAMLEEDFRRSREVEPGELGRKPYWFQVAVRLARLLSPVL